MYAPRAHLRKGALRPCYYYYLLTRVPKLTKNACHCMLMEPSVCTALAWSDDDIKCLVLLAKCKCSTMRPAWIVTYMAPCDPDTKTTTHRAGGQWTHFLWTMPLHIWQFFNWCVRHHNLLMFHLLTPNMYMTILHKKVLLTSMHLLPPPPIPPSKQKQNEKQGKETKTK